MARHLQLPADLNLDHPRALAPQWMNESHDHGGPAQTINSALVDKPGDKPAGAAAGSGGKSGGWAPDEASGQRQERSTWRAEDKAADQRAWVGQDRFHPPVQERFASQGRPRPGGHTTTPEHGTQAKGGDRWRDDGQPRWGHVNNQAENGPAPWSSPGHGAPADPFLPGGDNWNRQRQPARLPASQPSRADTNRWNSGGAAWNAAAEDHFGPRGGSWEGPPRGGFGEVHGRDAPGVGRGKGFTHFGRGRGLGREPAGGGGGGASFQRWTPGQAPPHPALAGESHPARIEDLIVPKLGTGPQRHKYTVEQMLTVYASLLEGGSVAAPSGVHDPRDVNGTLLSEDTEHQLLGVMDAIAQQMVEGGFATKAERRLASRLHALLEKSVAPEPAAAEEATADKAATLEASVAEQAVKAAQELEQASGLTPFAAAHSKDAHQEDPSAAKEEVSEATAETDEWFYKDPADNIQGPYSRQAIKDWHESGFFPLDLPLSRTRERPQFHTLQELLQVWRAAGQPGPPPRQPVPLLPQPAQQPAAPQPAPADSLLAQQGSMQTQNAAALTAASMRLDAAETGMPPAHRPDASPQLQQNQQPQLPERPASHPYLNPAAHSSFSLHAQPQQQLPGQRQLPGQQQLPGLQPPPQAGFPDMSALGMQLSAMGLQGPGRSRDLPQQHQQHQQHQLHGPPQQQASQFQRQQPNDLLSQLQFSAPAPDLIVSLAGSLNMNRVSSATNLAPIGPGAPPPAPYQPPLRGMNPAFHQLQRQQPPQPQPQPQLQPGQQDLLPLMGAHPNSFNQQPQERSLGLPLEQLQQQQASFGRHMQQPQQHFSAPFPGGNHSLVNQAFQPQPPQRPALLQPGSAPPSHRQELQLQGPPSLTPWLSGGPPPPQPPQPPLTAAVSNPLGDAFRQGSTPVVGPTPRRMSSSALPIEAPSPSIDEELSFQTVQKMKRKEAAYNSLEAEIAARSAPPIRKAPGPPQPPPEQAPPQEWQRQPTLAEAAGLRSQLAPEIEPAAAPWAAVQQSTPLGKSLLDIQREEAQQAKARTEAETAHQAAGMSAAPRAPSSWGKVVAQAPASQGELPFTAEDSNRDVMPEMVATEGVTSLKEIQEQERRMAAAGARAPPPLTAQGPPPSWSSAPAAKTASLRDRLQRDADHEVAAPPRPAAAPPRSVQAKPVDRPAVQEPDDDLFWDYSPQPGAVAKAVTESGHAAAPHGNGVGPSNGARAAAAATSAAEESAAEQAAEEGMDASLSPEFAGWCKARLRELRNGDDDLFLVQFLMTVASNAEVAEYLTQALGKTAAVSAFSNEFIKRKLAEQNGKKKGRSGSRRAAGSHGAAAGGKAGAVGVAPVSTGATGWTKMPKKKKKGQKVDAAMLGFETGTNYAALEKMEG